MTDTVNGSGRFRLVTEQGAERMTSADVLTLADVAAHLEIEEQLHRKTGWTTERHGAMLRCERGETVRWIWPREERETMQANAEQRERLEYLRGELRAERISYGELAELESLAAYIEPGDVELLEAAGVPEFPEEEE